ncbi:C-type mannose receptor 2-like [Sycon ciliatum]|uniref:C-type mannose receptor 2-like n=1 Tax=Sycon ciliatum TaxID=27933 RepID=UPI0031F6FAD3
MRFGDNCYYFGTDSLDFSSARAACRAISGSDLASILTSAEADFIKSALEKKYTKPSELWIGLTDSKNAGTFEWYESGAVPYYARWKCNLRASGSAPHCGTVFAGSADVGQWGKTSCASSIKGYVCKYGTAPTVRLVRGDCPSGFFALENKCYKHVTGHPKKWHDASAHCARHYKGMLMSTGNIKQKAFIETYMQKLKPGFNGRVWLGLRNVAMGPWIWNDRSCYTFSDWSCISQNVGISGEHCLTIDFRSASRSNAGRWIAGSCSEHHTFFCEIPISHATPKRLTSPTCIDTGFKCPTGWLQKGYSCYYFEKNAPKTTFEAAINHCRSKNGSSLVVINDETESAFLTQEMNNIQTKSTDLRLWIGLYDILVTRGGPRTGVRWVDDTTTSYLNWDCKRHHFFNGFGTVAHCGYMFTGDNSPESRNGLWGLQPCLTRTGARTMGYICELPAPHTAYARQAAPAFSQGMCEAGWVQDGQTCFYLVFESADKLPWSEARSECQRLGGDIAMARTKEENILIMKLILENQPHFNQRVWIGLSTQKIEGSFSWVDHQQLENLAHRHWTCAKWFYNRQPYTRRGALCSVIAPV